VSAQLLAKKLQRPLRIIWVPGASCPSDFHDLFKNPSLGIINEFYEWEVGFKMQGEDVKNVTNLKNDLHMQRNM
jgi:hypothetical protein